MSAEIADELRARLRDEWLRKATSSFTCQECGIQANFIDEIIDALDAKDKRIAELEAGGWQDIETAPKDGTHVLLFWPNIPAGAKSLGINPKRAPGISVGWFEASECGVGFMCEGDDAVPCNQEDCTHWQPLPAPPSRLLNKEDRNG